MDHDREEIIQQKHLLLEQIKQLENQIREQTFTIGQLNQELNDQKSTSTKLRYLSEEAEGLVQENQRQLAFKQDEVRSQEEKILRLEKKICKKDKQNFQRFYFYLLSMFRRSSRNKSIEQRRTSSSPSKNSNFRRRKRSTRTSTRFTCRRKSSFGSRIEIEIS